MLAGFTNLDYDEQFPEKDSPKQVAFLSHQVKQFESQLKSVKDASAAEAAEAASKLEEEQEAAREAECCRGLLKFLSSPLVWKLEIVSQRCGKTYIRLSEAVGEQRTI